MCIEIALWDRFPGWGPDQTNKFTTSELRILFAILEQQRVSKDYRENLGPATPAKLNSLIAQKNLDETNVKLEKEKSMLRMQEEAERLFGPEATQ